jgi:hypothetical protein
MDHVVFEFAAGQVAIAGGPNSSDSARGSGMRHPPALNVRILHTFRDGGHAGELQPPGRVGAGPRAPPMQFEPL